MIATIIVTAITAIMTTIAAMTTIATMAAIATMTTMTTIATVTSRVRATISENIDLKTVEDIFNLQTVENVGSSVINIDVSISDLGKTTTLDSSKSTFHSGERVLRVQGTSRDGCNDACNKTERDKLHVHFYTFFYIVCLDGMIKKELNSMVY
ncbi:hypothetical protein FB192DRAFT_1365452 [Mucor lusitanicus]|uniref:Uncharacterized protein n=1 Tax=Mucor circinelloides f. lusitanicus TaxID=29924 RepID=A0A8H4BKA3_MUCCL|nr:hypothetical protein FB192DRAFT_1365452 [Mucor lusitanicus]